MNRYDSSIYNLLGGALGRADSAALQAFVDATLADKYNVLDTEGFALDPDMQLDFTFEQVRQILGVTPIANYYDVNSPAKPFAGESVTIATGKIPRMKNVAYFNEDKLRKQLIFERINAANSDEIVNSRRLKLFSTVDDLFAAHANAMTYQRNQMVSTGKFVISTENNPYGISGVTIDANIPTANKTSLSGTARWWTKSDYSAEGTTATPIADLKNWVRDIRYAGAPAGHIEVNYTFFQRLMNHSKVQTALAATIFPFGDASQASAAVSVLPQERLVQALEGAIGCSIKVIDRKAGVEKYNATTRALEVSTVDAFASDVLVWVPDGTIGTIKAVMPITVDDPAAAYAHFMDGRGLLTVSADASRKCQAFETELTALAVPTVPQRMYYFYPLG